MKGESVQIEPGGESGQWRPDGWSYLSRVLVWQCLTAGFILATLPFGRSALMVGMVSAQLIIGVSLWRLSRIEEYSWGPAGIRFTSVAGRPVERAWNEVEEMFLWGSIGGSQLRIRTSDPRRTIMSPHTIRTDQLEALLAALEVARALHRSAEPERQPRRDSGRTLPRNPPNSGFLGHPAPTPPEVDSRCSDVHDD